jgi:hypothetical protein
VESIEKNEANAFLESENVVSNDPNLLQENETTVALQIVRLSFKGDNKWTLTDGTRRFNVAIKDEAFLEKVSRSQIFFIRGDILRVRLLSRTSKTHDGLKTDYSVLEVLDIIHPNEQLSLSASNESAGDQ